MRRESRELVAKLGVWDTRKEWEYEYTLLDCGWAKCKEERITRDGQQTVGFHVVAKLDVKEWIKEGRKKTAEGDAWMAEARARRETERVRCEAEGLGRNGEVEDAEDFKLTKNFEASDDVYDSEEDVCSQEDDDEEDSGSEEDSGEEKILWGMERRMTLP